MATTTLLPSPPTVDELAAVTAQQWTSFFQDHPTWLPPGTGNTATRIAKFIHRVETFFAVGAGGPSASFVLVTTVAAGPGATVLQFAPTNKIIPGMSVSGLNIPPGTVIPPLGVTTSPTSTSVTLSQAVTPPGVPANTNITFSLKASGGNAPALPTLTTPSQDWLTLCLSAYGAFTLGSGFDLSKLRAAAATVFAG